MQLATKEFDKVETQSSLFHELLTLNGTEKYFTKISMGTVGVKPILRYTFSVGSWKAMYDISVSMAMQTQEKVESLAKEIFGAIKANYETNKEVKASGISAHWQDYSMTTLTDKPGSALLVDEYSWEKVPTPNIYTTHKSDGLTVAHEVESTWSWRDIISLPTNDVGETNKETN